MELANPGLVGYGHEPGCKSVRNDDMGLSYLKYVKRELEVAGDDLVR